MSETCDLEIPQGASFSLPITWQDSTGKAVNLTGYSAKAQIRRSYDAAVVLLEFNSDDGSIVLGGSAGTIDLIATPEKTAELREGGVWDLLLTAPGGEEVRLLEGKVALLRGVTR